MTSTKPYTLNTNTYFGILLKTRFRKRGWLYIFLIAIGFAHLYWFFSNDSYGNLFWAVLCFVIPLFAITYLWRFSLSGINKEFLSQKQLFFDSEKIKLVDASGNEGLIPYDNLLFVKENSNYWLLYIDKTQFFYVPKNIFNNPEDYSRFQNYLQQ